MVIFQFIWNCIIGWIELLDSIPIIITELGTFSGLDLILSFLILIIFLKLLVTAKEDS